MATSGEADADIFDLRSLLEPPLPESLLPRPAADAGEADAPPAPGGAYRAYARAGQRQLPMLALIDASGGVTAASYHELSRVLMPAAAPPGAAPALTLVFSGREPLRVRIEGRNLAALVHHLARHAVAWVRECPPGKEPRDPDEPVVTRMVIEEGE